jgi:hypothetical protein
MIGFASRFTACGEATTDRDHPAPRQLPDVADVITAIGRFPNAWNEHSVPFITTEDPRTVVAQATGAGDRRTQQTSVRS